MSWGDFFLGVMAGTILNIFVYTGLKWIHGGYDR